MTRGEQAQELARSLGAAFVGGAADQPPEPLDAAILFAPVGDLVLPALAALDRGGTLAIAGIYLTDIPLNSSTDNNPYSAFPNYLSLLVSTLEADQGC